MNSIKSVGSTKFCAQLCTALPQCPRVGGGGAFWGRVMSFLSLSPSSSEDNCQLCPKQQLHGMHFLYGDKFSSILLLTETACQLRSF